MKLTIGQRIQAAGFAYGRALVDPDVSLIAQDDAWCRLLQRAAEVDALLARIRAAVAAERAAGAGIPHPYGDCGECDELHDEARAALDALLGGEE